MFDQQPLTEHSLAPEHCGITARMCALNGRLDCLQANHEKDISTGQILVSNSFRAPKRSVQMT